MPSSARKIVTTPRGRGTAEDHRMPRIPQLTPLSRRASRISRRGLFKVSAGGAAGAALAAGSVQTVEHALGQGSPTPAPQTHELTLTASEFDWDLMADVRVRVWGYNGQLPGPELRVTEGDTVRVT